MEQKINIELPVAAWNIVMNALGGRPYAEVTEVISSIREQAESKLKVEPEVKEAELRPID